MILVGPVQLRMFYDSVIVVVDEKNEIKVVKSKT